MEYIKKELGAMKFIGIGKDTSINICSSDCPSIWKDFMAEYPKIKEIKNPEKMYGISIMKDSSDCSFRYIAAVEVEDIDEAGDFEGVSIPAGNYYVFTHKGGIDTLPLTYSSIMEEIKSSGMTQDYYWIEAYDERYQSNSSESEFDILVPVLSIEK
ncbi:MAG: GyrI-like domain-containing protein [Candidatus Pacebacteria bacterium]|nr:GyrI-like domain-containing protein [Candidatus Paceibacterota bacterium]